jgi:glutamate racemase
MWVPLVENREHEKEGANYFVQKHITNILAVDPAIDTLLLACTHYPLLQNKIQQFLPEGVKLLSQGKIVAQSLKEYLVRHPEIESNITKKGNRTFYTTDSTEDFDNKATVFFGEEVRSQHLNL